MKKGIHGKERSEEGKGKVKVSIIGLEQLLNNDLIKKIIILIFIYKKKYIINSKLKINTK